MCNRKIKKHIAYLEQYIRDVEYSKDLLRQEVKELREQMQKPKEPLEEDACKRLDPHPYTGEGKK